MCDTEFSFRFHLNRKFRIQYVSQNTSCFLKIQQNYRKLQSQQFVNKKFNYPKIALCRTLRRTKNYYIIFKNYPKYGSTEMAQQKKWWTYIMLRTKLGTHSIHHIENRVPDIFCLQDASIVSNLKLYCRIFFLLTGCKYSHHLKTVVQENFHAYRVQV